MYCSSQAIDLCLAGLVGPHVPLGAPQLGREDGVAALVLKPSALGGFERTLQLAAWARHRCSIPHSSATAAFAPYSSRQLTLCQHVLRKRRKTIDYRLPCSR